MSFSHNLSAVRNLFKTRGGSVSINLRYYADDRSPLNGVRVLDLTRIVAGPYCTMILGDLGAEVIKVEKPGVGDEARKWGPPYVGNSQESCYFVALNRNKKSICVDMKTDKGQQIIHEIAAQSDVFIENFVPGKLDEVNLGYDRINQINPAIIYCSITGYGSSGPYSQKPGYDVIASSIGGLLHITGPECGEPVKVGVAVTDMSTGLYAHGAILSALFDRTRTGIGQKINVDLLSTQLSELINIGSNYLNAGIEAKRWGTAHESIVPYEAFPTKDGYYTIGTGSDKQFVDLCKRLDLPDIVLDPKYKTNKLRVENRRELIALLRSVLKTKTNLQWSVIFEGAEFPCGAVNSLEEVFKDDHIKAIDIVKEVKHPVTGSVKMVGPPVRYSYSKNEVRTPPPSLGEHTTKVLTDLLRYDEKEINILRSQKIIL